MHKLVVIGTGIAGLLIGAAAAAPAWSQSKPKTCSDAYAACTSRTQMTKECETEKEWCKKTGSFADPKTKAVTTDLQKR